MRTRTVAWAGRIVLAMTLAVSGLFSVAGQNAPAPQSSSGMPEGPGRDVTVKVCSVCHDVRVLASLRLTRDGWKSVVDDMVQRGATGTDEELARVLEYLSTHFLGEAPRSININTAPSIDLESVVGLLRSEAKALIDYREKSPCKVIDDLKKVPGLDFKKIEAARDRIVCM
jgi:DNA uptake protein ComE-like DNA-binding protein